MKKKPLVIFFPGALKGYCTLVPEKGFVEIAVPGYCPSFGLFEEASLSGAIFSILPFFISSMSRLLSAIHALPNKAGEYHTPPNTNADIPARLEFEVNADL